MYLLVSVLLSKITHAYCKGKKGLFHRAKGQNISTIISFPTPITLPVEVTSGGN